MKNSHIEWTDHTFNPWIGCSKVSPGCAHCYAESLNLRWAHGKNWGRGAPRRRTSVQYWNEPRRWNAEQAELERVAALKGEPIPPRPRVFCASLADVFDAEVAHVWRADLFKLIRQCPNLNWLLLTKRPENIVKHIAAASDHHFDQGDRNVAGWLHDWIAHGILPDNIWLGTTVEDQRRAEERIPVLAKAPARVRFLSCEPLLEQVNLGAFPMVMGGGLINWVIAGGESGPHARPMNPDWARLLRDMCSVFEVPFHFKQWGEWAPATDHGASLTVTVTQPGGQKNPAWHTFPGDKVQMARVGKKYAGRKLDGVEHNGFP